MKTSVKTARARLREWYRQLPGRLVLQAEQRQLAAMLPSLGGKRIIQIGYLGERSLLHGSPIPHHIILDQELDVDADIHASPDALPFDTGSIDVLVLPHTLEFAQQPQQVLQEVNRVLTPEGHLIIIGFNPWGLWSGWRIFRKFRQELSWCNQFWKISRLHDELAALDFRVFHTRYFFMRPPWHSESLMRACAFLEILEGLPLGSLYLLLAQKRVAAMTPMRLRWEEIRPSLPNLCWAEPSAPEVNHGP